MQPLYNPATEDDIAFEKQAYNEKGQVLTGKDYGAVDTQVNDTLYLHK